MIFVARPTQYELDIGSGLGILGLLWMADFFKVYSRARGIEGTWQQGRLMFPEFRVSMMSRFVFRRSMPYSRS